VNAITGVMLFAADASTKGTTTVFFVKLALLGLAVFIARLMQRLLRHEPVLVTTSGRAMAVLSVVLWLGAMTAGRLMAYV
jgi:hypothetical protein